MTITCIISGTFLTDRDIGDIGECVTIGDTIATGLTRSGVVHAHLRLSGFFLIMYSLSVDGIRSGVGRLSGRLPSLPSLLSRFLDGRWCSGDVFMSTIWTAGLPPSCNMEHNVLNLCSSEHTKHLYSCITYFIINNLIFLIFQGILCLKQIQWNLIYPDTSILSKVCPDCEFSRFNIK